MRPGNAADDRRGMAPWDGPERCIRPSKRGSAASRPTSAPRRPRRPGRRCASRRPAAARRRRSWRAPPGSSRRGRRPTRSAAITFNKRAAVEMTERLDAARGAARRRGRGRPRPDVPRARARDPARRRRRRSSRWPTGRPSCADGRAVGGRGRALLRLDTRHLAAQGRARRHGRRRRAPIPNAGPVARAFVAYEARRRGDAAGSTSTTSSSARSRASRRDPALLARWRARCRELLVDEVQDVDRAQLRLALLLAAPANRIFLVGDDDQSIYGWRLADVRRILGLEDAPAGPAPGRPRGQLPLPAAGRRAGGPARRAQRGAVRQGDPGRAGGGRAGSSSRPTPPTRPSASSGRCGRGPTTGRPGRSSPGPTASCCPRSSSRSSSACRSARRGSTCCSSRRSSTSPRWPRAAATTAPATLPLLVALGRVRDRRHATTRAAARGRDGAPRLGRRPSRPRRPSRRRSTDAASRSPSSAATTPPLTLATAHATKGLEFDHVIVVGMEAGRFPSARAVARPRIRSRAYEEERRLGLRRVDAGAPVADAAVRPGGPLPVPARGVQPGRARAQPRCPVELADRAGRSSRGTARSRSAGSASRIESLTPYAARQRVAVARSARRLVVAQAVGQRLEVGDPARRSRAPRAAASSRSAWRAATSPASSMAGSLVAGGSPGRLPARASVIRAQSSPGLVPSTSSRRPPDPAGRAGGAAAACAPSR